VILNRMFARWTGLDAELAEARADAASAYAHVAQLTTELVAVHRRREAAEEDAAALHTELDAASADAFALGVELVAVTADRDALRDALSDARIAVEVEREELEIEHRARLIAETTLDWERHERAAEREAAEERHAAEAAAEVETAVRQLLDALADRLARPFYLPTDDPEPGFLTAVRCGLLLDALVLAQRHAPGPEERAAYAALHAQLHTRVHDALAASVYDTGAVELHLAAALALAPADDRPVPAPDMVETVDDLAAEVPA
jgi:hypothetical protein